MKFRLAWLVSTVATAGIALATGMMLYIIIAVGEANLIETIFFGFLNGLVIVILIVDFLNGDTFEKTVYVPMKYFKIDFAKNGLILRYNETVHIYSWRKHTMGILKLKQIKTKTYYNIFKNKKRFQLWAYAQAKEESNER